VLVGANAEEALRLFEGNASIDLVLTDGRLRRGSAV
jgi:hypothetical protein